MEGVLHMKHPIGALAAGFGACVTAIGGFILGPAFVVYAAIGVIVGGVIAWAKKLR